MAELSREILHYGDLKKSHCYIFFLFVLLFLYQFNFEFGYVPGELSGGYFQPIWISGKKFPRKGGFRIDQESD